MSAAGENHLDFVLITSLDDLVVANASPRLDNCADTRLGGNRNGIGKRKKCVGGEYAAASSFWPCFADRDIDGVNATHLSRSYADERLGFNEITNIYYAAGFHEPGSALSTAMNLDVFNDLTPAQQRIVEVSARAVYADNASLSLAENGAALARLQSQGVVVRQFPDDVWDAFGRASVEVREENMGDPIYAKVAESYFASLAESSGWYEIGDGEYMRQRNRVNAG